MSTTTVAFDRVARRTEIGALFTTGATVVGPYTPGLRARAADLDGAWNFRANGWTVPGHRIHAMQAAVQEAFDEWTVEFNDRATVEKLRARGGVRNPFTRTWMVPRDGVAVTPAGPVTVVPVGAGMRVSAPKDHPVHLALPLESGAERESTTTWLVSAAALADRPETIEYLLAEPTPAPGIEFQVPTRSRDLAELGEAFGAGWDALARRWIVPVEVWDAWLAGYDETHLPIAGDPDVKFPGVVSYWDPERGCWRVPAKEAEKAFEGFLRTWDEDARAWRLTGPQA